jgi:hypothetical protein
MNKKIQNGKSCVKEDHSEARARAEIATFFRAIDSYPARFSKKRTLTFNEHLCSYLDRQALDERIRSGRY